MISIAIRRRSSLKLLMLSCFLLWSVTVALGQELEPKSLSAAARLQLENSKEQVKQSKNKFQPPPLLSLKRTDSEVSAQLDVNYKETTLAISMPDGSVRNQKLRLRMYNEKMIGPEIRVKPGDLLKIKLINNLKADTPPIPADPTTPNKPHGFNDTNLHTHGLHVSPKPGSDDVSLMLGPGESRALCFDLLKHQTCGTFWYHAHCHGSTAFQLYSGMAGALIVEGGGLDAVPEIKAAAEKVLVFQQLRFRVGSDGVGVLTEDDAYTNNVGTPGLEEYTLINGIHIPSIDMKPGEVQRWRCIHGGITSAINLAIVDTDGQQPWTLHEIARDGLPLYRITSLEHILLQPGYRSDFLVRAPRKTGDYLVLADGVPHTVSVNEVDVAPKYIAKVHVSGTEVAMSMPDPPEVIGQYALPPVETVTRSREFRLRVSSSRHTINDLQFGEMDKNDSNNPRKPLAKIDVFLGTAEEWSLLSEGGNHPFHIHVNPFEVIVKNPTGTIIERYWKDTVVLTPTSQDKSPNVVTIRSRFEDFPGETVLHCHNLRHEDLGMMWEVHFNGPEPKLRCPLAPATGLKTLPADLPAVVFRSPDGSEKELSDFKGDKLLVVFHRGLSCSHCRGQLDALAVNKDKLAEMHVKIIAVSPDSPAQLSRALSEVPEAKAMPIQFFSDEKLNGFKAFGCFDGYPLHGSFVVDTRGRVTWQAVGDDPYRQVGDLLERLQRSR